MFSKKGLVWGIFSVTLIVVALSCRLRVDESTVKAEDDVVREVFCWSDRPFANDYHEKVVKRLTEAANASGLKNISAPSISVMMEGSITRFTLCVTADKKVQ